MMRMFIHILQYVIFHAFNRSQLSVLFYTSSGGLSLTGIWAEPAFEQGCMPATLAAPSLPPSLPTSLPPTVSKAVPQACAEEVLHAIHIWQRLHS